MALVFSDDGVKNLLHYLLTSGGSGCNLGTATLHLFKNNITPTDSTVLGDFTEADFSSYATVALSTLSWPTPSVTAHVASAAYSGSPTWTKTGATGNSIYGWYATQLVGVTTTLICSDRFAGAPLDMTVNGNQIILALTFSNQSLN